MLSYYANTVNSLPRTIINNTVNFAEWVGERLDKVAEGLQGKNSGGDDSQESTVMLKKHFDMLERLRRTKPVNYKNLTELAVKLTVEQDKAKRDEAIVKAFAKV